MAEAMNQQSIRSDDRRSLACWLDEVRHDVRYARRTLIRNPGFTLVVVLTLALGIGANTAIFSVVNTMLLRPLPYRDADRIMTVWQANAKSGAREAGAAPGNFIDWRRDNSVFSALAAAEPFSHNMSGQGEPESFPSWQVTVGFFQILGVEALFGRTLTPDEYRPGAPAVVVLSHGLWVRRFGADRALIGQAVRLNGQAHTVVGVMPPAFEFPPGRELWAPRIETERDQRVRGSGYMPVVGRLKPGATLAQAQDELTTIAARLARDFPQANLDRTAMVVPLREQLVGNVKTALAMLLGAVGFVLLIACSNVANLLVVRASERSREFAVRSALGAGRGRLTRQWLTESSMLAIAGSVAGVLLARASLGSLVTLGQSLLPNLGDVAIDRHVLAYASLISVCTALLCGLAPVFFVRPDVNESLKQGGRGPGLSRYRLRHSLVIAQMALAMVLLVGAGLLTRSFHRLLQINPGFISENILALEVHVWGLSRTPDQQAHFFDQTLDHLAALPRVQAAAAVSGLPFHGNAISPNAPFAIDGRPAPRAGEEPTAFLNTATADYFRALGIPLRQGRLFTRFDRQGAPPVVLINEALARRYWGNEDPVGRRITARLFGQLIAAEVVGVVGDVRPTGLDSEPRPEIFVPHLQFPYGSMTYVVRTAGDPATVLPAIKQAIWAVNPNLPFTTITTMQQLLGRSSGDRRFILLLVAAFSVVALALAAIGIYGTISFAMRQRRHEIGVRMALGEPRQRILRMVINEGVMVAACGVALGLVGALFVTPRIQSLLFAIGPADPMTFAAASLLLLAVAVLASLLPARRATRVDPMVALRSE
jgi:putative ABC transport system permease protein